MTGYVLSKTFKTKQWLTHSTLADLHTLADNS